MHRRLALRGSPATARGCGELWRALLTAAVAVSSLASLKGFACLEGLTSLKGLASLEQSLEQHPSLKRLAG